MGELNKDGLTQGDLGKGDLGKGELGKGKASDTKASWLLVGLGNPGPEYEWTRHNIGFLTLDHLCSRVASASSVSCKWTSKFKGHYCSIPLASARGAGRVSQRNESGAGSKLVEGSGDGSHGGSNGGSILGSNGGASGNVHVLKPQTFMNLSGESVLACSQFFQIPKERILVVHDEVDLAYSGIKLQRARGHGGHNGIRSLHQLLGGNEYLRLRLGVGKSPYPGVSTADHVLGVFTKDEKKSLPEFLNTACDAIEMVLFEGFEKAATRVNAQESRT